MRPLQIWLPFLGGSFPGPGLGRDLVRAQRHWDGHGAVWLSPDLKEPLQGLRPLLSGCEELLRKELAVPTETRNRIDVIHLGENGYLYDHQSPYPRFGSPRVEGLLESWLNLFPNGCGQRIQIHPLPETAQVEMPRFELEKEPIQVWFERVAIPTAPVEVQILDRVTEKGEHWYRWPPEGWGRRTISPTEESRESFGPLVPAQDLSTSSGLRVYTSQKDPTQRIVANVAIWPPPFTGLFPCGGGMNALECQVQIRKIAKLGQRDPEAALRQAWTHASRWLSSGTARLFDLWLAPCLGELGLGGTLTELEGRFDLGFATWEEATASERFQSKMRERVEVRRVLGPIGLFWALLLDQLEQRRTFRTCQLCGRFLQARKDRTYCHKEENPRCFRDRQARDKRRNRAKKSPRSKTPGNARAEVQGKRGAAAGREDAPGAERPS